MVFAKVRPGFQTNLVVNDREQARLALDVGGVAEFYPNRHVVLRFDVGDVIIPFGNNVVGQRLFAQRPGTTHNFQFSLRCRGQILTKAIRLWPNGKLRTSFLIRRTKRTIHSILSIKPMNGFAAGVQDSRLSKGEYGGQDANGEFAHGSNLLGNGWDGIC